MRKVVKRTIWGVVAFVLLWAVYVVGEVQTGNFHEVIPGEFYRSAQPTGAELKHYAQKYGIKSVVNLRGMNVNDAWYLDELGASTQLGVKMIDYPMKASRELTDAQAMELIQVMRDAPKPMLIHCRSGADRSGLAAALYMAGVAQQGEAAADYQLSIRYGHMPLWFTDAAAMRRTFERLEPLFGYYDS